MLHIRKLGHRRLKTPTITKLESIRFRNSASLAHTQSSYSTGASQTVIGTQIRWRPCQDVHSQEAALGSGLRVQKASIHTNAVDPEATAIMTEPLRSTAPQKT